MEHSNRAIYDVVLSDRVELGQASVRDDPDLLRWLVRMRELRRGDPHAVLKQAVRELKGASERVYSSYVDDDDAIVVVVSSDGDIEAILGGYMLPSDRAEGQAQNLSWLSAHLRTWLPTDIHDACGKNERRAILEVPRWRAVAEWRRYGGSVVLLVRTR